MINIRAKGQVGEREVADDLNTIINLVHDQLGLPRPEKPLVQRNQNQSAVGGCDLTGTFWMAIEVKRQEQLAINTWWAQCVKSAAELDGWPVLLFRQNAKPGQRTKWRCMTFVETPGYSAQCEPHKFRAELEYEDFKLWFKAWALKHFQAQNPQAQPAAPWPPLPPGVVIEKTRLAA